MDRNQLAADIAADLFETERATNAAFAAHARLAGRLAAAHSDADLALKVGADAVSLVSASMGRLAGAREDLAAAHDRLEVYRRALRLQAVPDTGGGEKPPNGLAGQPPASQLRAVG